MTLVQAELLFDRKGTAVDSVDHFRARASRRQRRFNLAGHVAAASGIQLPKKVLLSLEGCEATVRHFARACVTPMAKQDEICLICLLVASSLLQGQYDEDSHVSTCLSMARSAGEDSRFLSFCERD